MVSVADLLPSSKKMSSLDFDPATFSDYDELDDVLDGSYFTMEIMEEESEVADRFEELEK